MSTPARPDSHDTSAHLPVAAPQSTLHSHVDDVVVDIVPPRDVGWLITALGAVGTLVAGWTLFGAEADGMWAGYWTSLLGTTALIGSLWTRTTLAPAPGLGLAGLSGIGLVLSGALHDYPRIIDIPMIAGGAVIVIGAAIEASAARHR